MTRRYAIWLLLAFLCGLAAPAWASGPPVCTISGTVYNADGSAFANGYVTFQNLSTQTENGYVVAPQTWSSATDSNGNMAAVTIPQGLQVQATLIKQGVRAIPQPITVPANSTASLAALIALGQGPSPVSPFSSIHLSDLVASMGNYSMGGFLLQDEGAALVAGEPLVYGQNGAQLTATTGGIALRSSSAITGGSGSTFSINAPSGLANGDVEIAAVSFETAACFYYGVVPTFTPPSGWTLVRSDSYATDPTAMTAIWDHVVTNAGGEPSSYSWTMSNTNMQVQGGGIADFTGVNNSTPVDASSGGSSTGVFVSPAVAAMTLANPNETVLGVAGNCGGNSTAYPGVAAITSIIQQGGNQGPLVWSYLAGGNGTPGYNVSYTNNGANSYFFAASQVALIPSATATAPLPQFGKLASFASDVANNTQPYSAAANPLTGYSVNGRFNVVAYGADPTGQADAAPAINAAVNAACTFAATSFDNLAPTVFFPTGVYNIASEPVLDACAHHLKFEGVSQYGSVLKGGKTIPLILAYPSTMMAQFGAGLEAAPLVGSSGNSLVFGTGVTGDYYNLGDVLHSISATPLNGLSQFTVEAFINAPSASPGGVWASGGALRDNPGDGDLTGFGYFQPGATTTCQLDVGGTVYKVQGTSAACGTANTTCWAACGYDGSTIRVYTGVPGATATLVASQAASGTLVQRFDETMDLGGYPTQGWPDEGVTGIFTPYTGKVFSFRLSNTARYGATAPTTPNAELAGDGNTLLLINGDVGNPSAGLIGADYVNGNAWNPPSNVYDLVIRGGSSINQGKAPSISHLNFFGGADGIFVIGEPGALIDHVNLFAQSHAGILLYSNSYEDILSNIIENNSGVVGIEGDIVSQYYVNNAKIIGGYAGLVAPWHAAYTEWSPSDTPGVGILFRNPDIADENTCVTCDLDTENGGSAVPFVVVGIGGGDTLVSPNMQTNASANVEGMDIEGPVAVTITGGEYTGGTPAEIIKFDDGHNATNARAIWTNPQINGANYTPSQTIPISNEMNQMRVVSSDFERQPGLTVNNGINFANFPASVINGASFYCPNCDPPANPPVACTSAGTKTGAWVHGINGAWVCGY